MRHDVQVRATSTIVIGPMKADTGLDSAIRRATSLNIPVDSISFARIVHLDGDLDEGDLERLCSTLLIDPLLDWWKHRDDFTVDPDALLIETGLRPGVTDREAAELMRSAAELGLPLNAASIGTRYEIHGDLDGDQVAMLIDRVLHNSVIERAAIGELPAAFVDTESASPVTQQIRLRDVDDKGLVAVGAQRRLGLDLGEMQVIAAHFDALGRDPNDAEIEMIAQTWSEHCSHKTFRAEVTVTKPDGSTEVIDGLLKTFLRGATDTIDAPWVHSAFVDNAGIVAFEDGWDIALKAETHNHPSALEPFGGANTGVGGVVRDILGVSAQPVAITDILCFGPEQLPLDELPDNVLHPSRIRSGVIAGVGDYGNKIGVPNIGGAIVHDPAYTTTPLVFAGCIGLLPTGSNPTNAQPGDSIVVLGGAVGRDGVGGATFSSQSMGVETADVAGSSVQIGDPIVEKGLIDVILAARDQQLYTAVTDCGAGGLSSSVGEMAEELGAEVDLELVPRKYPGLAPWEVWLSEAQERMVVASSEPETLIALARRFGVEAAQIGTFRGDGRMLVVNGSDTLIDLDCSFIHGGRPKQQLEATTHFQERGDRLPLPTDMSHSELTLQLLAHPSIRSNEDVVRTFDHEVLGGTLIRPYGGPELDGPADGAALIPPGTSGDNAIAIGIGLNALVGDIDAEAMAWMAIDEAVRNAIIAGANPNQLSLLDNFAWGNPTDPETLGKLVAACRACHDASLALGAPFVSGKDSLYNVFVGPDGIADPVASTLVITAVGIASNLDTLPLTGTVAPGNDIWLVGGLAGALGGSHLDDVVGADLGGPVPSPDLDAIGRHHAMAAAITSGVVKCTHDVAEGGIAVAASEWAFAGRVGLGLDIAAEPNVLFGEGAGRYLVEVSPQDAEAFAELVPGSVRIGSTNASDKVTLGDVDVSFDHIGAAYRGHFSQLADATSAHLSGSQS